MISADQTSVAPLTSATVRPVTTELAAHHSTQRDLALDFTKGALVLCMVAYHTLNYFRYDVNLLRHLHFLPPSFIFISGYLIAHHYLPKLRQDGPGIAGRLFVRGLKVFALFVALNVLVQALFPTSYNRTLGLDRLAANLAEIFLTGEGRATVFGVLLPISYILFLSAALLCVVRRNPSTLALMAVIAIAACAALAQQGALTFNLELLSMGLLGMGVGLAPRQLLKQTARNLALIVGCYLAYSLAVRLWYPTYLINTAGVLLSLLLFYSIGFHLDARGNTLRSLTVLGNYSLLGYLAQIAILQILFRLSRHYGFWEGNVWAPFIVTGLLTYSVVKGVDLLRARSALTDRSYRAIFA